MNKIILTGLRDIKTDDIIVPNKDYGIFLVASRISEEKVDSQSEEEADGYKFRMKISHLDGIVDLKEKKEIKHEKGMTKSQKLRWVIEQNLGEYEPFMDWLMTKIDGLCDEYRENNIYNS